MEEDTELTSENIEKEERQKMRGLIIINLLLINLILAAIILVKIFN